jgi:16S rRNA processing protein RimM
VNDWLRVGYVSRAHGLKGTVVVKTFDPASSALGEVDRVHLAPKDGAPREVEIVDVREGPGGDLLLQLEGLSTREGADALVGSTVSVHRDEIDAPDEGEFFQGDLVGLRAVTPDGKALGVVHEVWSSGPVPNLVLRDGDREEMVPFAEDFVRKVDLAAGTIVIEPPTYDEP